MFTGGCLIILGAILTSTSSAVAQFVIGRLVLGFGIMFMTVAAPAYAIEIAPPHWRGRATGFYNCGWFGGSIPAAFVTYGCQYIKTDYSWKIPLILQCFASVIVIVAVFFIPESPRYMVSKGKEEEALAFFTKYHGNGNPNSRLVVLEMEEIRENIRNDRAYGKNPWDWRPLFSSSNSRWRTLQTIMMGVFGQFTGNGLNYYNTDIFQQLGEDSTQEQLGYNILSSCLGCIGALTGVSLSDRMPRRKALVWGTLACSLTLAVNAGLANAIANDQAAHNGNITNLNNARGALAFYFIFQVVYSFAYTPLQGIVPAEALDTTLRAKGLAMYGLVVNVFGFINLYAGPIALANIKYKYIYVFVGWDLVETVLWYFLGYVQERLLIPGGRSSLIRLLTVLRPRAAPSRNSSGFTTRRTPLRLPSKSTRSSSRATVLSLRRSLTSPMSASTRSSMTDSLRGCAGALISKLYEELGTRILSTIASQIGEPFVLLLISLLIAFDRVIFATIGLATGEHFA